MKFINSFKLKTIFYALIVLCALMTYFINVPVQAANELQNKNILFFYGQGCPHCAKVEDYFNQINAFDNYPLVKKEIYFNRENAALFNTILDQNNIPLNERGVPTLVLGSQIISGDQPIISQFSVAAEQYLNEDTQATDNNQTIENSDITKESVSLWLIISAALVDAINPCAFAVLLILLTTVLAQKSSRAKVLTSGFAFTLAIFVSYLLMGLGVYTALASVETTNIITLAVGLLAIILGLFNLKDWLWYGKTAPMEVPMSWRPKMAKVIEKVTSPAGAIAAGLLVSLFLLPCTSGPYIVILGLLSENPGNLGLLTYLFIYNIVFVLPMIIITFAVAYGLKIDTIARLREQYIDKLHLIAGVILVGLGIFVLINR